MNDDEEVKKNICMRSIYKALEDGWTVKKTSLGPRTFEFTRSSDKVIVEDKQQQPSTRRSISSPIIKSKKNDS